MNTVHTYTVRLYLCIPSYGLQKDFWVKYCQRQNVEGVSMLRKLHVHKCYQISLLFPFRYIELRENTKMKQPIKESHQK